MITSIPFVGVIMSEIDRLNLCITEIFTPFFESHTQTGSVKDLQITFQDYAGPSMEGILELHHDLMFLLALILGLVCWLFFVTGTKFNYTNYDSNNSSSLSSNLTHGATLEIFWTATPSILLLFIGVPTFALLYSLEEGFECVFTLKVIAHQWYWSYEYSDFTHSLMSNKEAFACEYDSFMVHTEDLEKAHQLRLLQVDNLVSIVVDSPIRVLVTSADVLHSWAVPAFGVKMDCICGRLNQFFLYANKPGVFYGQCSELCGENHGFMPIMVQVISIPFYIEWITKLFIKLNS